jgi:hypothetical protein
MKKFALACTVLVAAAAFAGSSGLRSASSAKAAEYSVAARQFGRDGDFAAQLGEYLPALRINRSLEVFDLRPFAVTGHGSIQNFTCSRYFKLCGICSSTDGDSSSMK